MKFLRRLASGAAAVAWLAGLPLVHAATLDITAQFRADSGKPNENTFVNTTRNSGYCAQFPAYCESAGIFSLGWAGVASGGPIQANHQNPRQGPMVKAPAIWRTVQVTHAGTGHTENLQFRVVGLGAGVGLTPRASEIVGGGVDESTAVQMIFGSTWRDAPSPCITPNGSGFHPSPLWFFWKTPTEATCAKPARYSINRFEFAALSLAYELRTPNPIGMAGGRYQGSLTLTLGPGQDFDFGDVVIPNDPVLTVNFTLDVEHVLKIEVPPGGNRVVLEPRQGWQAWLDSGVKPTELFRDQTFLISASSPFTVNLECQYNMNGDCGIDRPGISTVPVYIYMTLPDGFTNSTGQPINRIRLFSGTNNQKISVDRFVDRKPGTLHFVINSANFANMIDRGPGTYAGTVTVIWNSEI
ncbi:hypothetical protein J3P80_05405 [Pseudomonas sp. D2-30]|uniref:hypothetical protein n=1 Tax=unclassified Pseudomonas TaxID=196821 RepID=UPI003DA9C8BF